jgi:hypothetical protein
MKEGAFRTVLARLPAVTLLVLLLAIFAGCTSPSPAPAAPPPTLAPVAATPVPPTPTSAPPAASPVPPARACYAL